MLSSSQFINSSVYFQSARPQSGHMLESRETAEQVLLSSLRKLDKGKRSRTGLELKRSLLIAFTLFKARQILWQYAPPIPASPSLLPPVQCESPNHPEVFLASDDYSPLTGDPSMLSALEGVGKEFNTDFWTSTNVDIVDDNDAEEDYDEDDDSDSDDIDIDEEDPFNDLVSREPIFPPPFPGLFLDSQSLAPPTPSPYSPPSGKIISSMC